MEREKRGKHDSMMCFTEESDPEPSNLANLHFTTVSAVSKKQVCTLQGGITVAICTEELLDYYDTGQSEY